jgi:hypothetical protein
VKFVFVISKTPHINPIAVRGTLPVPARNTEPRNREP